MTLQQLQYVIAIVEHGSISETAKQLYVAQPTLSSAVRTLEEEFGILIFHRSARGIALTEDGREFLSYARQVVEQADLLHQHYGATRQTRQRCSISTQHYAFAVDAFVQLIQRLSPESYEFTLRETRTHEIMEDVRNFDSEIGILYLSSFNEKVLRAMLEEYHLEFHSLAMAEPHVFLRAAHPLAKRSSVTSTATPFPSLGQIGSHIRSCALNRVSTTPFTLQRNCSAQCRTKRVFASATVRHCSTCSAESTATPFAAVWSVPT